MKRNYLKILSLLFLVGIMFIACSCITDAESIEGKGPNFIRADAGPDHIVFPPAVTSTAILAKIWRDANSKSSLNKKVTVDLTVDDNIVTQYNADHQTSYVVLDPTLYTFSPQSITFEPGEFEKTVSINLNAAGVDTDLKFAIGLKMDLPSGWTQAGAKLIELKLPNQYAGDYASTGTRYNYNASSDANTTSWPPTGWVSSPTWSFDPYTVSTINSKTIAVHAANSLSFGRIDLTINNDNSVTVAPNADCTLNALQQSTHRPSTYDPATQTFELYYEYTNTNGTFRNLYHKLVKK